MTDRKMSDLITKVERELSMVPGLSVQVYAKDSIMQKISSTFELVYQDKAWKRFRVMETRTLNGTTGNVTAPFTLITDFDDINRVFPSKSSVPLSSFPLEFNPTLEIGGLPRSYSYNTTPGYLLTCHPATASGDIIVLGQQHPIDFALDTVVPFDDWCIIWGTAWQYAVDDAANPGAITKFQHMFETRKKQLYNAQTSDPIRLTGNRGGEYPTSWSDNG